MNHGIIICGDAVEHLPRLVFEAIVTDPPYGLGEAAGKNHSRLNVTTRVAPTKFRVSDWDDETPDLSYFPDVPSIIFGGNYFPLPPASKWLVWDKDNGKTDFADCELAWTNLKGAVRLLKWRWNGMLQQDMKNKEKRVHPTMKPVPVMEWCLQWLPPDVQTICDPYMGSGSTGAAALRNGYDFIGIEADPEYCDVAAARIEQYSGVVCERIGP